METFIFILLVIFTVMVLAVIVGSIIKAIQLLRKSVANQNKDQLLDDLPKKTFEIHYHSHIHKPYTLCEVTSKGYVYWVMRGNGSKSKAQFHSFKQIKVYLDLESKRLGFGKYVVINKTNEQTKIFE